MLAHPDPAFFDGDSLTDLSTYPPVKTVLQRNSGSFSFIDENGIKWLSHGIRLDNGWGVIILQQESEVLEKERLFWQLAITVAAVAVLGVGALVWLLTSRLIQPITDLTLAATNLSSGEWNQRVNISRNDELGTLANAFNQMAEQLQVSFAAQGKTNEKLEIQVDHLQKTQVELLRRRIQKLGDSEPPSGDRG